MVAAKQKGVVLERRLESAATHVHVDLGEYCRLVTSRRRLWRLDDPANGLRGLYDPRTRIRYVIDDREARFG